MRKQYFCLLLGSLFFVACQSTKKDSNNHSNAPKIDITGYLLSFTNDWGTGMDTLGWEGITELNLAFLNPEADGSFAPGNNYTELVKKAKSKNVKIFFSIGGGEPPAYLASLIEEGNRERFADNIAAFADQYDFDGVDVDLENSLINENYAAFVSAVSRAMKARNKKMTAALASWNANQIHDSTLALFDKIHIMSYDKTGPWRPDVPGQHSPISMTESDFNYFHQTRRVAAGKLSMGVPFYGYGFGAGAPASMNFHQIARLYPESVNSDSIILSTGGRIYFNGKNTIAQKAKLAVNQKAGGIMIWQLSGDAKSPHSLMQTMLKAIEQ